MRMDREASTHAARPPSDAKLKHTAQTSNGTALHVPRSRDPTHIMCAVNGVVPWTKMPVCVATAINLEDASAQALTKCMVEHCKATLPGCYPKPHKHHDSAGAGQSGPDGRIGVNRGVIASSAGRSTWKEGDRWKLTSCACSGPGKSRNRFILCHLSLFLGIIPSTARLNGSTGFFL